MIRKNSLFCKLIRIKISSKSIFHSFMNQFIPQLETCPICHSKGQFHIHDYYSRNIIDFHKGSPVKDDLCIMRIFCDSCQHAHAILPDFIVPHSSYGLFFMLRVLAEFFTHLHTVEHICERFDISAKTFYKWLALWKSHKEEWLGILDNCEICDLTFMKQLCFRNDYSSFSMSFIQKTSHSFLQSHKNPVLKRPRNAHYHQQVFLPDHVLW
ncbi:DUF6431 domain-containing protein [Anaerostipes caccae]|uniref:DUF6431 domain-containing protein n=1 Tax=Anaerostipes TaxID=207244 RepID=UPI003A7F1B0F